MHPPSEKGEVLLRGVGTLRCYFPPSASVQWQPGDLTIHTKKCFLGAGFLGAPPISLTGAGLRGGARPAAFGARTDGHEARLLRHLLLERPAGCG